MLFHPAKNNTCGWEKCPEKGSSWLGLICHGSEYVLQKGWCTSIWGNYQNLHSWRATWRTAGTRTPCGTGRCWQVFVGRTGLQIRRAEGKGKWKSTLLSEACTILFLLLEAAPMSVSLQKVVEGSAAPAQSEGPEVHAHLAVHTSFCFTWPEQQ